MPNLSATSGSTEPRVRAAIEHAAVVTGVDFNYLYNQARIESSLDPQARARTSSAAGLFQFTRQTWLQVVRDHGSAHGVAWAANAISGSGPGLTVVDPNLRKAIDALRYDPELSSAMAGEFASDNRDRLQAGLGRDAAPVDLYLAHFLGSAGATSFLNAHNSNPDAPAAPLFPAAAAANRAIFYSAAGAPRSLDEIRTNFAAKLDGPSPIGTSPAQASPTYWKQTVHTVATSPERAPAMMGSIEPIPQRLSLDFAARAYQRLAGISA